VRRDIDIKLLVRTYCDVLQLVPVGSAQVRAAPVRKVRNHNFRFGTGESIARVNESADSVRFGDIEIKSVTDALKDHPMRKAKPADKFVDFRF
jgi:hypothetical protein